MSAERQHSRKLQDILVASGKSCDRLLNALNDERNALKADDTSQLSAAVARKKSHLADLESLETQRRALLAACKYKDDMAAMERFIHQHDSSGDLMTLWQQTMELVRQCRESNRTNGIIIAAQQRQQAEALNVLREQDADTETYGPQGKTETTGQYRAIAEV
ncbi:MAG: flagellar protein FlgN [Pseudomonadota bacterium]